MDSLPPAASGSALELAKTCPKIPALVPTWKTCGKTGCHCRRGAPHGPYWSLRWRDGPVHRRRYVRAADLDAVRAVIAWRQVERAVRRAELAESTWLLRQLEVLGRDLVATDGALGD
jgi:uncharacterized protein DUF6788